MEKGESKPSTQKNFLTRDSLCCFRVPKSLTPTLKVLSGSCAPYGAYPWTVQIQVIGSGGYDHHCGGTILTEDIILTAAHCIDERWSIS